MDPRLLPGILDVLVLEVVSDGPSYGYQITQTVLSRSAGHFELKEGSLYPALHRLEERDWVVSEWQLTEHNRRAKFYQLTTRGRQQLRTETASWTEFVDAVGKVLRTTAQPA